MALVDYSESDSDPGDLDGDERSSGILSSPSKRKRDAEDHLKNEKITALPPLPAAFHDLYATNSRVSVRDDPSLHGGRKRVTPHIEGNWPTHVYLECYPTKTELDILSQVVAKSEKNPNPNGSGIHSLLKNELGAQLPLHISLSRSVSLSTSQRQPFEDLLTKTVNNTEIRPFEVTVSSLDWVPNYENTRWFLVMRLNKPTSDGLNRLLRISNQCLSAFGQPALYERPKQTQETKTRGGRTGRGRGEAARRVSAVPTIEQSQEDCSSSFHISIAWSLFEPSDSTRELVNAIDIKSAQGIGITFSSVKAKIGNTIISPALPTKIQDERGFAGT